MSSAALIPIGRVRPRRMSWSGTLPVPQPSTSHLAPESPRQRSRSHPAMPPPLAGSGWHRDATTLRRVLTALAAL
ncbi:hypothetical protein GCM10027174_03550 [Salinifilum aidingensis]